MPGRRTRREVGEVVPVPQQTETVMPETQQGDTLDFTKNEANSFSFVKADGTPVARVRVLLGWEGNVDLDVSCFLVNRAGECNEDNFVFYNSNHKIQATDKDGKPLIRIVTTEYEEPWGEIKTKQEEEEVYYRCSKCHSVVHKGDVLTGGGDNEEIFVNLDNFPHTGAPEDIVKIRFVLTIYKKPQAQQKTFANVSKVQVAVYDVTDRNNQNELRSFVIPTTTDEYRDKYSMNVGAIVFDGDLQQWSYESYEKAEQRTLPEYAKEYNIVQRREIR